MKQLQLSPEQERKAEFILNSPHAKLSSLLNFEVKDLAVYWSFYSGKIEGNTYSYIETMLLLKDDITAAKSYEEALMLKNLYNAFISCARQINLEGSMDVNAYTVKSLHSIITDGLLPVNSRGVLRDIPVRISGTDYIPTADPIVIESSFSQILEQQHEYQNPLARAAFLHCNLARLQPFRDGNKRTARLVESIVLMNSNIIPVRSNQQEDIIRYRKAIVEFYENENYSPYIDFAFDTQINRINEIAPPSYQYGSNSSGLKR